MAKQKSLLKFEGSIGDLSFYQTRNNGFAAREKTGVDGKRIRTEPRYARTRENMSEFGHAGTATSTLREALREFTETAKDSTLSRRLHQVMNTALKGDTTSRRGERRVMKGDISKLVGFEFNSAAKFKKSFRPELTTTIDRVAGSLSVSIPEFIPTASMAKSDGITHARLILVAAEIDFATGKYLIDSDKTELIPYTPGLVAAQTLNASVTPQSTKALLLILGAEFVQLSNGEIYSLNSGTINPLVIVEASLA